MLTRDVFFFMQKTAYEMRISDLSSDVCSFDLHGGGNIIPGLEKALLGKKTGDKLAVKVEPSEGYGERNDALIQQVPRRAFQGIKDIEPGMSFQAQGPQGPMRVTVTRVDGDMVTVDGNHPLAGENLNFVVEIR